jgi:hypothetical protein
VLALAQGRLSTASHGCARGCSTTESGGPYIAPLTHRSCARAHNGCALPSGCTCGRLIRFRPPHYIYLLSCAPQYPPMVNHPTDSTRIQDIFSRLESISPGIPDTPILDPLQSGSRNRGCARLAPTRRESKFPAGIVMLLAPENFLVLEIQNWMERREENGKPKTFQKQHYFLDTKEKLWYRIG